MTTEGSGSPHSPSQAQTVRTVTTLFRSLAADVDTALPLPVEISCLLRDTAYLCLRAGALPARPECTQAGQGMQRCHSVGMRIQTRDS
eukprot:402767-Rhodomonas_salina.3